MRDDAATNDQIQEILKRPVYDRDDGAVLDLFRTHIERGMALNEGYRNFVEHWPKDFASAELADFPYLPVGIFKREVPLALCEPDKITRVIRSSATTGQQPAAIPIDLQTGRTMAKSASLIFQSILGPDRRPFLVIDAASVNAAQADLNARGAAIRSLMPFAKTVTYGLSDDDLEPLIDQLSVFSEEHGDEDVLVYGFTWVLWARLVDQLQDKGIKLNLKNAKVLHSGGWKKLTSEAVDKATFNQRVAEVVGCTPADVIDFYGMVENLGVVYPDGPTGFKHPPIFGGVVIRDPLTLEPVSPGETGLLQVCSIVPTSFPGWLLLTDDMAELVGYDDPESRRPGPYFRLKGRAPKAEIRGCGEVIAKRFANA
ncbi:MAG: acyl-protein synthetase [Alphaproteobacteria bacterium]|nr:acyl-protein synthetase [Alphaproteobacteria bacterium SS10]